MDSRKAQVTQILERVKQGDPKSSEELMPLVYAELKELAARMFQRQNADQTLQPTALVHEVYLRLADQDDSDWRTRSHLVAVAVQGMRQILVDQHRRRNAAKRGADWNRITFAGLDLTEGSKDLDVVELHEALEQLAAQDERSSRIVALRFFGGLSMEEIAAVLEVSLSTVEAEWRHARAWLRRKLESDAAS